MSGWAGAIVGGGVFVLGAILEARLYWAQDRRRERAAMVHPARPWPGAEPLRIPPPPPVNGHPYRGVLPVDPIVDPPPPDRTLVLIAGVVMVFALGFLARGCW